MMIERIRPKNGLVEWAVARERLRLKKAEGGMPPWSDDPILNEYRFCNVRRRDDRVSQWLIRYVLNNFGDYKDRYELWTWLQWTALCRWVNWPPTIKSVIDWKLVGESSIDFASIARLIDKRRLELGMKAWTGAYIVRAPSKRGGYAGWTKGRFVTEVCIEKGMHSKHTEIMAALETNSLEKVYDVLCSIDNWGQFMAGQVLADWTYTPLLGKAVDLNTWAPMGPGSRRGYNRMVRLPLKHPPPHPEVWCQKLQEWRADILVRLGAGYQNVTLHDVQNCLCEYDKYERTRLGEGRPRSRYVQETSY